jgi:type IV secretion system protein VirD4
MSQLKSAYKDSSDTIIANCDSTLFLGSTEMPTLEWVSKMLGKETIDTRNFSLSQGNSASSRRSDQKTGRELMTPDELRLMPGEKCILFVRGIKPFKSDKFHTWEHKRASMLGDDDHPFNIKNSPVSGLTGIEKMTSKKES